MNSEDSNSSFGWVRVDETDETDERSLNIETSEDNKAGQLKMVKLEKISGDIGNESLVSFNNNISENRKLIKESKTTEHKSIAKPTSLLLHDGDRTTKPPKINSNCITVKNNSENYLSNNKEILEKYIKSNLLKSNQNQSRSEIGNDDDIWLLQCPRNLDVHCLVGLNFLQKDKKKFKIGNNSYECVNSPMNNMNKLSILEPPVEPNAHCKLSSLDVRGIYFIREKMTSNNDIEVCEQPTSKIPFPSNLKKRHPLLGVHYKSLLKIPASVNEKLKNPVNNYKKMKKINEIKEDLEAFKISEKSSRKRKGQNLDTSAPAKKIKKESVHMWTSESSIEKSLFVSENSIKKQKGQNLDTLKPAKKIKKENGNMWTSELSIEKSLFELPAVKKKHKNHVSQ